MVWRAVGEGSLPRPLTPGTGRPSWAPDGRTIAFARSGADSGADIWTIDLPSHGQPGPPAVLIDEPGNQRSPRFSPDGRFLAYESDQSGRPEIYVQRFPTTAERWVVSRDGGSAPRWSRPGPELHYRARDGRIMAVAMTLGPAFKAAEPQPLFLEAAVPGSMSREFDVAPDGQRFLVVARAPGNTSRIVVVQNWLREFER
jgi:serine/threonine-protein kinase